MDSHFAMEPKTDDANVQACRDIHETLEHLGHFQCSKILKHDTTKKVIIFVASVQNSKDPAVLIMEKSSFSETNVKQMLGSDTGLEKTFHNDIYGNYTGFPRQELNGVKVTVIHPATSKHIEKYSDQESFLVNETPALYKEVLLEHLKESSFNVQWVYNILEHRVEEERIVFELAERDTGFILLPDLKWDGVTTESLYLVAIVHRRDLRSIRDLRAEHLPLLRAIWTKGTEAIEKKYGVPSSRLRVYFHYQPSYYHLHVHFNSVRFDAPGTHVGKAHLLPQVISNIELMPDYYARATLSYYVGNTDRLADRYRRASVRLELSRAEMAEEQPSAQTVEVQSSVGEIEEPSGGGGVMETV